MSQTNWLMAVSRLSLLDDGKNWLATYMGSFHSQSATRGDVTDKLAHGRLLVDDGKMLTVHCF